MSTSIHHKEAVFSETDMKNLIRNSLMIAGQELGDAGDHWPVVKNTITDIMHDWEELEIQRAVHAELKRQMKRYLDDMEEVLKTCKPSIRAEAAPHIADLREVYDAAFSTPEEELIDLNDNDELPIHIKRAEAIIDTLFDDSPMEGFYA